MAGFAKSTTFGVASVAAGLVLSAGVENARADIAGINTATFQANVPSCCSGSPPAINNATGTVTSQDTNGGYNGPYQGGTIFDTTTQDVSNGFTASFTFKAGDTGTARNGIVFVLENDPAGDKALGDTNEGLNFSAHGYPGTTFIANSSGLVFDFNTNNVGIENQLSSSGPSAASVGAQLTGSDSNPFVFAGDTVSATVTYDASTDSILVNLLNTTTGITASTSFASALPYITPTGTYVGFAIGDGSYNNGASAISVSNFSFADTPVPEPAGLSIAAVGAAGLLRRRKR